ncbi:MAG: conjugative transfer ATPase, partial [Gammaproteobacteria bacterium]
MTSNPSDAAPLTTASAKQRYARPPSFTDLLPWMEYIPESKAFLLEDGVSLGALFDVQPVGCEARTPAFMTQLRDAIQTAINEAIPERDDAPWVLQVYVQDEPQLTRFNQLLASYPTPAVRASDYSRHYQNVMAKHLQAISRPGGLFDDTTVTGSRWQGQQRRIRVVLYRRLKNNGKNPSAIEVEEALNDVATKWIASLASAGIIAKRADGQAFYEWLLSWFNPNPSVTNNNPESLLQLAPYPGDDNLPFGYDFAEQLTLSMPRSDEKTATWLFDNLPHTVITVQSLRRVPDIGHFTAERQAGDQVFSLFDRLPEHTIMAITLTLKPQDTTRNHIAQIKRASVGDSAEASITREDAVQVEREMAQGNKLYPVSLAFYVRGENQKDLRTNRNRLNALLLPHGLQPITQEADLLSLDSYIRNLPMAYDVELDKTRRRSRLVFSRHIANLLPFYGRSRGTGHPGLVFYNRGAEPLVFDPLHRDDRKKNAHMLILGPTGAGKSALLVYLLQQMMARHRPRIFIIEAGASFSLLGQHFAHHGLSVNQITLNPNVDVSLPPFADALRLLDRRHAFNPLNVDDSTLGETLDDEETEEEIGGRDILGEMEIAARIMITGGDEREDARLTRADRLLIRNAIFLAAKTVKEADRLQVITQDVVNAFQTIAGNVELPEHR